MELLIADDNPLSLHFLADAATALGHRCDTASDGAAALRRACAQRYELLLLDVRMPLLDGPEVLRRLRADASAASQHTPALATTADSDAALARALREQGFAGVMAKPVDLAGLQRALSDHAVASRRVAEPVAAYARAPLLDDAAACRSLGSSDSVAALRGLFRQELDALPGELDACLAQHDGAALRDRLHRLCASAGFCGAPRLEQVCRDLRARLGAMPVFGAADLAELREVAGATRQALAGSDSRA